MDRLGVLKKLEPGGWEELVAVEARSSSGTERE